jgi:hypothetical protein
MAWGRQIMKWYFSIVIPLAVWGLGLVFIPLAQATTVTKEFIWNVRAKEWCGVSATHAKGASYNIKDAFKITIVSDPLNNGTQRAIRGTITNLLGLPATDLETITMEGVAYQINKSNRTGEFAISGVRSIDPSVFLTLRGKLFLDKFGVLKKLSGIFVYHSFQDSEDCFGNGTFQTIPLL